jgi:hypothetical protein
MEEMMFARLYTPVNHTIEVSPGKDGVSLIVRNELDGAVGFYSMTKAEALSLAQILEEASKGRVFLD